MEEEIDRSGQRRYIAGVTAKQVREVAKYLEKIQEDGADLDEAVQRLKNCTESKLPRKVSTGDPKE